MKWCDLRGCNLNWQETLKVSLIGLLELYPFFLGIALPMKGYHTFTNLTSWKKSFL